MTREEIIAAHDARHLQHALNRVKAQAEKLQVLVDATQARFPSSKELLDIQSKLSSATDIAVAATLDSASLKA